jgi:hypothetical protein
MGGRKNHPGETEKLFCSKLMAASKYLYYRKK